MWMYLRCGIEHLTVQTRMTQWWLESMQMSYTDLHDYGIAIYCLSWCEYQLLEEGWNIRIDVTGDFFDIIIKCECNIYDDVTSTLLLLLLLCAMMSVTYRYFLWRWWRTQPELPGMGKVEKLSSWQRKIQMIRKYKTEVYVSNLDRKTRIIKSLTKTTNTVNKTGFGVHFRAQQACTVDVSKKTNICDLTWRVASVPTWPFSDPMNSNVSDAYTWYLYAQLRTCLGCLYTAAAPAARTLLRPF